MNHDINKQPKWVQQIVKDLYFKVGQLEKRVNTLNSMIPWSDPDIDMHWFTIGVHEKRPLKLFTLHENGARQLCDIGPNDRMFIGRGKRKQSE